MNTKLQPTVTSNKPLISVAQPLNIISEGCPCGRSAEQALVVHCKRSKYDVYIGRPSKWGNPFVIGKDGNREQVIAKYRHYLLGNAELLQACIRELKGKVLGCWCAPCACHGDVLAQIANEPEFVEPDDAPGDHADWYYAPSPHDPMADAAYWDDSMKDVELPNWGEQAFVAFDFQWSQWAVFRGIPDKRGDVPQIGLFKSYEAATQAAFGGVR